MHMYTYTYVFWMYTLMRSQQEGTDGATDSHEGDGVDLLAGLTRYVHGAAPSEADLSADFALSAAARGDAAVYNTVSPAEYLEALVGGGGERVEVVSAAAAGSVRASVRPQSGRAGRREEGGRWACARGRAEGELRYGGGAMGERAGAEEAEVVWYEDLGSGGEVGGGEGGWEDETGPGMAGDSEGETAQIIDDEASGSGVGDDEISSEPWLRAQGPGDGGGAAGESSSEIEEDL